MPPISKLKSASEQRQMEASYQTAGNRGGNGKVWADLFRTTSKPSTTFQLRKWKENEREIAKDELRHLGFCLVGYLIGRSAGRSAVDNVRKSWKVASSCSWHGNGWLIFRFSTEEDRDSVLLNGPYESLGSTWLLKKLPQFFNFSEISFASVPTWIRLQGLPLECWTENALGKLASFVGEPLAADECTATMTKTAYARILVEVDLMKPLVRRIRARLPDGSLLEQEVLYEREPQLCSKCKKIGHNEGQCRMNHRKAQPQMAQAKLQLAGTSSAAVCIADEVVSQLPATKEHRMVELQGGEGSIHADPTANSLLQHQKHHSAAKQQPGDLQRTQQRSPVSDRQIVVAAGEEGSAVFSTDASAMGMEHFQLEAAEAYAHGDAKLDTGADCVVEFPSTVTQLLNLEAATLHVAGNAANSGQTTAEVTLLAKTGQPRKPTRIASVVQATEAAAIQNQEQISAASKLGAGKEATMQVAGTGHTRRITRNALAKTLQQLQQGESAPSANVVADDTEVELLPQQHGAAAHQVTQQHGVSAEHKVEDLATRAPAVAHSGQKMWLTCKMQQSQEPQPMAVTTADQIICIADEPMLQDTRKTAPDAADVQVPKQLTGPKWKNNRKTRSAAKKRGSPT